MYLRREQGGNHPSFVRLSQNVYRVPKHMPDSLPGARGNTKAIQKGAEPTEKRERALWMEDGQGS